MTIEELSPLSARCVRAEQRVRELRMYLERVLSFAKGNEYTTLERSLALRGARNLLDELNEADLQAAREKAQRAGSPRLARGTAPGLAAQEASDGPQSEAGERVECAGPADAASICAAVREFESVLGEWATDVCSHGVPRTGGAK